MKYSNIDKCEYCNGEGIGVSLFVQGCHFHCKDCFNSETWDFNGGKEFTNMDLMILIHLLDRDEITRFTVLGGEPLSDENCSTVLGIIQVLKSLHPDKQYWIYSGYTYEEIMSNELKRSVIELCDVLVDGRFETDKKDLRLKFRGSTNQRVIDLKRTFKKGAVALYCD